MLERMMKTQRNRGHVSKRLGLSVWNSGTARLRSPVWASRSNVTWIIPILRSGGAARRSLPPSAVSNQRLLERLEAENAQLRRNVVDLMLQVQALRDGARCCRHLAGFR
jgi:hypothetical protein